MNNSDDESLAFIDFWISPNQTDYGVFDQPKVEQNDTIWREKVNDFGEVEPAILCLGIVLLILATVLQAFSILYERFEMDSMKRGFTNQMITARFAWGIFMSVILILRFILTLLPIDLPYTLAVGLQFLKTTGMIGICLTIIEVSVFEYMTFLILKRVPEYDHDFLATGFQIVNVIVGFYFGALQIFEKFASKERVLKLPAVFILISQLLALISLLHYGINKYRTRKSIAPVEVELQTLEKAQSLAKKTDEEANPETSVHRKKGESKAAFLARVNEQQDHGDRKESTVIDIPHAIVHQDGDQPSEGTETQDNDPGSSKTEPKLVMDLKALKVAFVHKPPTSTQINSYDELSKGQETQDCNPMKGTSKVALEDQIETLEEPAPNPELVLEPKALEPVPKLPLFKLNTNRFNVSLTTLSSKKISWIVALLLLIPTILAFRSKSLEKYSSFFFNIGICLYHPLLFCILNKKLLNFILSHFRK